MRVCSKSHMLIAGVTGGAIACSGVGGIVPAEWAKVLYGMAFSLVAGFVLGWLPVWRRTRRSISRKTLT